MGEVHLTDNRLVIHSVLFFYGSAANDALSQQLAQDIATCWNEPAALIQIARQPYQVYFDIEGIWAKSLTAAMVFENTNPCNNYFRIERYAMSEVSFVDGLGCNTGYLLLDNLLQTPTTIAHEYGHTLGLDHPAQLDIRGQGVPGIMYPRGSWVDADYQYSNTALPGQPGGTINPACRKVRLADIEALQLHRLNYIQQRATLGGFSSVWHQPHG
ncbi:MAG: hypothetical protein RL172_2460 [Bacteroidota bacterium]|jgi:hypothetical protein